MKCGSHKTAPSAIGQRLYNPTVCQYHSGLTMAWDLQILRSAYSRVVAGGTLPSPHPAKMPMKGLPKLAHLTTPGTVAVYPISRTSRTFV
ncbi:hypothetical protein JTB14_028442 [Gonioctena quinquepunctata]|nr:hypothetical protein JTB14_028442 [Gonioctena quinquepunctata]